MSVQRYDLDKCIGCKNCLEVCPMDVFRFNEHVNKSIIAYPENCQNCGQCFVYCLGHSLAMSGDQYSYPITSVRGASTATQNRQLVVSDNPQTNLALPVGVGIVGGLAGHNVLIWGRKAMDQRAAAPNLVPRMSVSQRWQHFVMLLSFFTLVGTGFSMRFFSAWMEHTLGFGRYALKLVHLSAGVTLLAAGLYHLAYIVFTPEGRKLVRDMWPASQDVRDLVGTMRYYLRFSNRKPVFGRFGYPEKSEYWMLVGGTTTMGVTGVMLWAYFRSGRLFSDWWVSAARGWHFWEAIVASLAIVVWHFYQVIFDPDVAPMNFAWLDGKVPAEHTPSHSLDIGTLETPTLAEHRNDPDPDDLSKELQRNAHNVVNEDTYVE